MPEGCYKHSALWCHLCPLYSFDGLIFKEADAFYHVGWQGEAPGRWSALKTPIPSLQG